MPTVTPSAGSAPTVGHYTSNPTTDPQSRSAPVVGDGGKSSAFSDAFSTAFS